MSRFRTKHVFVDAVQWRAMGDHPAVVLFSHTDGYQHDWHPAIHTRVGTMRVTPGDWIITDAKGDAYPIKPDDFANSYEPAIEPETPASQGFSHPEHAKEQP
jgi:hypothetical protein